MLVIAASDKGGTGRSVTSSNVLYRRALRGYDVCYLDFDFGSPTVGTVFQVDAVARGTTGDGLHSYLQGAASEPQRVDVWTATDRAALRYRPPGAGRLVLLPGDAGGGEFPLTPATVSRCADLLLRLSEEFDTCLIDLSAGRSYALQLMLEVTASPQLRMETVRWLIFHRWTRQHIIAAGGLVTGSRGLLDTGAAFGHDPAELTDAVRFVRTAVVDPASAELSGLRPEQVAWLQTCNTELQSLASHHRVGRSTLLGAVPLDPVLQWREQIVSNEDVLLSRIANEATVEAFGRLAERLDDESAWTGL